MPSPFPGMDPYLEDPALWPDVHGRLINVASEMLLAALRPRYFIQIDERLYVSSDDDESRSVIIPDLRIREVARTPVSTSSAVATIEPGIEVDAAMQFEVREAFLRIIDRQDNQVVTVVEILSPANKLKGSEGWKAYEQKRQEVIESKTNLVEIDLLRTGAPLYRRPLKPLDDYMAQMWRWTGDHFRRWIWPMCIEEPLKTIPIPVRLGDFDAALNLQAMLITAYDRAGYELRVDYSKEPIVPLKPEQAEWARKIVRAQPSN